MLTIRYFACIAVLASMTTISARQGIAQETAYPMSFGFARMDDTEPRPEATASPATAAYARLSDSSIERDNDVLTDESKSPVQAARRRVFEAINDFRIPSSIASRPSALEQDLAAEMVGSNAPVTLTPAASNHARVIDEVLTRETLTDRFLRTAGATSEPTCGIAEPTCQADSVCGCEDQNSCRNVAGNCYLSCCGSGSHCTTIYGQVLFLRARNAEVAYAVPADGPMVAGRPAPIQVGNVGILDPDHEIGFRAGVNVALDSVSNFDIRYTLFESLTEDATSVAAPVVLRSLVTHPSTASAAQDGLAAQAILEIDFDLIDLTYRHLLRRSDCFSVNYVVGTRYAKLEQQFQSQFDVETVATDIDFDGAGVRIGLETERYSCRHGLHVYANGYASFLAGRFRAHYFQGEAFDPSVVNTEWEAGRIVPILDLEAGVGWTSTDGKCSLSAGYLVSAWFDTVTTSEFIAGIRSNNYLGLSDTMTFDGLQARFAYRF